MLRCVAATKAGSLEIVIIMIGAALFGRDWSWAWRVILAIIGVWATMPVASHVLARTAFYEQNVRDDKSRLQYGFNGVAGRDNRQIDALSCLKRRKSNFDSRFSTSNEVESHRRLFIKQ